MKAINFCEIVGQMKRKCGAFLPYIRRAFMFINIISVELEWDQIIARYGLFLFNKLRTLFGSLVGSRIGMLRCGS